MGQRLIITEEERNSIIRLHKSNIFEAGPAGQDPELQQDVVATQQSSSNQKILDLQNKLNSKFNSGLMVDGKWGPKTATAVSNALKSLSNSQPTPTEEPLQKLPILPAGTVKSTTPSPLAQGNQLNQKK